MQADNKVEESLKDVADWVKQQNYEQVAINNFMDKADCLLIAHAQAYDFTVVSHEKREKSRKRIKIPDVCIGLIIECISTFAMLLRERPFFVLASDK